MPHSILFRLSPHGSVLRWGRLAGALSLWSVSLALVGCASAPDVLSSARGPTTWLRPYKIDIQQGNVVTREQVQALQVGISREQVREIVGVPLLASVFHADRWDYVFTFKRAGQVLSQRTVTVFFKNQLLERVQADEVPTEAEFVASLGARARASLGIALPMQATEAQLKAFQARNANAASAPDQSAAAVAPETNYPPLETLGAAP